MTEIVEAIDDFTATQLSAYTQKLWGFSELMTKTAKEVGQVMPVTIPERKQVSLDDRCQVVTWIRQNGLVQYEANEDWSFGKSEARFATVPFRMVFAHKVALGENLVYEFINEFPSKFFVPDYKFVFVSPSLSVDPDHETIYNAELGPTVYEKHRFDWNIYVININAQFIICEGDYRVTSDGSIRSTSNSGSRIVN